MTQTKEKYEPCFECELALLCLCFGPPEELTTCAHCLDAKADFRNVYRGLVFRTIKPFKLRDKSRCRVMFHDIIYTTVCKDCDYESNKYRREQFDFY